MSGYYFDIMELRKRHDEMRFYSEYYQHVLTARVDKLAELCGRLPNSKEAFFIETSKSFSAFTFVAYVLREVDYIEQLYIATYSTNQRIINAIAKWMRKGKIGSLHIHVSETLQYRMPDIWRKLRTMAEDPNVELTTAWSHKKVCCMKTQHDWYVVEGSGNYGENSLQEQYVFINNKEVCQFRMGIS